LRNLGLCGGSLAYEREGFRRALYLTCTPACSQPVYVGAQVVFDLDLLHGQEWRCCLELAPEIDGRVLQPSADPHGPEPNPATARRTVWIRAAELLERPFERGREDFYALAVPNDAHPPYVVAGVPWFMTLF